MMWRANNTSERIPLTRLLRKFFNGALEQIASLINKLGISPNLLAICGVFGNFIAFIFLGKNDLVTGGILVLFSGLFDALDGAVARVSNQVTRSGAFLDALSDRISEILLYIGLLINPNIGTDKTMVILIFISLTGSILVSI